MDVGERRGCHLQRSKTALLLANRSSPYLRNLVQGNRRVVLPFKSFHSRSLKARIRLESCWHDMAASSMPIPRPPRTPTPPLEEDANTGVGMERVASATPARITYNPSNLSPIKPDHPSGYFGGRMSALLSSSLCRKFLPSIDREQSKGLPKHTHRRWLGPF